MECQDCSAEFQPTGPRSTRCPKCATNHKTAYHREYMRKRRGYTGKGAGSGTPTGEDHPGWKHGERAFQQRMSPAYKEKVRYCERCGLDLVEASGPFWAVHHKDYDRTHNTEDNFELLCKRCHQVEHECWKNFTEGSTTISKESTPEAIAGGSGAHL